MLQVLFPDALQNCWNKYRRQNPVWEFTKTIIPFTLVGYEVIITNDQLALRACWSLYHFISNWGSWNNNWRLRWKKGGRIFTQNWTLSKTLQISHAVLFRCVKQCSVCFFAEVFFVYEILRMQKSLYLWSHQHVTGKTVISLKIQQNIDLLQRVTLKSVYFRVKPLQFWFHVNVRPQRREFHSNYRSKILPLKIISK